MAEIGTLNFGIGGDDKELRKIFEDRKKDAEELQSILSNLNFGTKNSTKQYIDAVKLQETQNKLVVSNAKAEAARENAAAAVLLAEQKVNDALEKGNGLKIKNLKLDNERLAAEQKLRTETERTEAVKKQQLVSGARLASIESERAAKEALNQQKLLTEIQRTEAAKKRAALVGTSGQQSYSRALELTNKTMFNQKALLQQLSNAMGIYFSIYQAGAFVKELAMVSGEFEKQRLSLAAILQNEEAAAKIFNQIKDLAVYSPFNFKELTDYAKQLSAFSIPTEELFDTMKRLADISSGLGVDMGRIILAYGQVRSAAVLRGQELRQFTEAGIPLVDELAKKFGELENRAVSAGEVFDKISNREVPFAMVKEIFEDLTNEGGKFYEMQEIQATSLAGMISNLRDAYDIMLDSIGKANRGFLKGAVGGLVDVMDNWEKYWKILKAIILTYGTYKAVVISVAVAQRAVASFETIQRFIQLTRAITGATTATAALAGANRALGLSSLANPITAIASALGLIVGAIVLFSKEAKSTDEIINDLDSSMESFATTTNDSENKLSKLLSTYEELSGKTNRNESEQARLNKIISELAKTVPNAAKEFDEYGRVLTINSDIVRQYNDDQKQFAKERLKNQIDATNAEIEELNRQQKAITDFIQFGETRTVGGSNVSAGTEITYFPEGEKLIELQNERAEIGDKLYLLTKKLTEAENLYNGSLSETNKETQELSYFAQQINSEINKLNIGDDLKEKIKVTDVTKDFQTIKQEAVKSFEELQEKVAQMNAAPLLFLPKDIENAKEMLSVYRQFVEILGGQETKKAGSTKDSFTERLKEQTDLIKQAKSEYDKLLKIMSPDKAAVEIKSVGIYSGVDINSLSDDGYITYIESQIAKLSKRNTEAAKNTKKAWERELASLNFEKISEDAKKQVDEIEKYLSKYKDQYTLYETLFGLTGDKKQAVRLAFGDTLNLLKSDMKSFAGNVDLLARPMIEATELVKKGWQDAGEGIATVYSSQYGIIDALGNEREILVTPILPDGSILSPSELEGYIDNVLNGATDILKSDTKGLVIAIDVDKEGKAGEHLHNLQEQYYDLSDGVATYAEVLEKAIANTTNPETRKKLEEQLDTLRYSDKAEFTKQMASLLAEFQTTEEKIVLIRQKGEERRLAILKNTDNAEKDIVDQRLKANQSAINKEIAELTNGAIQATDAYQHLFGNVADISERELNYLISKWKNALSEVKRNTDGSMSFSIDGEMFTTTEKEIASFTKRVIQAEIEIRDRNPFRALVAGIDEYKQKQEEINNTKALINWWKSALEGATPEEAENISDNIEKLEEDLERLEAEGATSLQKLGASFADVASDVSALAKSLTSMFDAFGAGGASDTFDFISELGGSLANLGLGLASGNYVQAAQGIIGSITSIVNFHDKRLDKAIQKSQLEVKKLGNAYSELSRTIERQLGAISEKQAKEQIKNLKQQQKELERQRKAEEDKKKTDKSAIEDYNNSIAELQDRLKFFYEDLFSEQFGIELKNIADDIASSLVDAFAAGEDAAKAFDDTVADIINDLAQQMISLEVLQPAMESVRDYLFGDNGVFGDGVLSISDAQGLIAELVNLKGSIAASKDIWDALNEAAKEAGIDLGNASDSTKDTLSKGIQSITEDTANLLASYVNSMRAYLAQQVVMVQNIMLYSESSSNTLALMQADIMLIQINTLATANNTARLVELTANSNSILNLATTSGSGIKFNI